MKSTKILPAFSLFFVTIVILVYVTSIGIKNFFRYNIFKSEYKDVLTELNQEIKRNTSLTTELNQMKQVDYWEMEIRKKLNYIKPGEEVYKFIKN